MRFDAVYYEPDSLHYPLGKQLKEQYGDLPWFPIENHNRIEEMQQQPNSRFAQLKRHLVVGVRKTHKYVENFKISDYLVPYTSSGCTAMCPVLLSGVSLQQMRVSAAVCQPGADARPADRRLPKSAAAP